MRQIRYAVAMSLDGAIAGPNGETDWIITDSDIDFSEIISRFDTFLVGRRTFEAMHKSSLSLNVACGMIVNQAMESTGMTGSRSRSTIREWMLTVAVCSLILVLLRWPVMVAVMMILALFSPLVFECYKGIRRLGKSTRR